jgi:hypothetical protein
MRRATDGVGTIAGGNQVTVSSGAGGTAISFDPIIPQYILHNVNQSFLVVITGNTSLRASSDDTGSLAWKYAWSEAVLGDDLFDKITTARSGTTSERYAINAYESFNTDQYKGGVDTQIDDYPDGFQLRPIGITRVGR